MVLLNCEGLSVFSFLLAVLLFYELTRLLLCSFFGKGKLSQLTPTSSVVITDVPAEASG